jgi:hypothetical protein
MPRDRGQAYTLEGIIGAIIIASALVLGLGAVDVAPWTGDTTDRNVEQLRVGTQDALAAASDRGALGVAATCIDGDGDPTPHPAVAAGGRPASERSEFATLLQRSLLGDGYDYVVYVDHPGAAGDGAVNSTLISPDREVTSASVTATRHVPLFDSDPVLRFDPTAGECAPTVGENDTLGERYEDPGRDIYIADQNNASDLYAVVTIRVIAW